MAFATLASAAPRGTFLGSINHLMVFGDNYLELLGLPVAGPARRPELLEAPLGLDGVVFKTDDAEAGFEVLAAADLADRPPAGLTGRSRRPGGVRAFSHSPRPRPLPDGFISANTPRRNWSGARNGKLTPTAPKPSPEWSWWPPTRPPSAPATPRRRRNLITVLRRRRLAIAGGLGAARDGGAARLAALVVAMTTRRRAAGGRSKADLATLDATDSR